MEMVARKDGSTNKVVPEKSFIMGTSYSDFESLILPSLKETFATIQFEIPEFHGNVWFDNLEIVEVDAEKVNPDDYILFEYNTSKSNKAISIPANYVDSKGNPVSGSITLKPYSSAILFKKLSTSTGIHHQLTDSEIRLMPNPASNQVTIKSNNEILSAGILDMKGQLNESPRRKRTGYLGG